MVGKKKKRTEKNAGERRGTSGTVVVYAFACFKSLSAFIVNPYLPSLMNIQCCRSGGGTKVNFDF